MQLTDIRSLSRYLATGDASDTSFTDANILMLSNANYHKLVAMAVRAVGDFNMVGRTKLQRSIAAATRSYSLPTTFLVIKAVEVKYPSSAQDYEKAEQISHHKIGPRGKDDYTTPTPEYDLYGSTLELFLPAKTSDILAVTNGINIYYEDEITALSGATDETILPEFANRLLCLMNAADYCMANEHAKLSAIKAEIGQMPLDGMAATGETAVFLNFLASRSEDKRPRLSPRREDYGQGEAMRGSGGDRSANFS